jgi:hypothetical protein
MGTWAGVGLGKVDCGYACECFGSEEMLGDEAHVRETVSERACDIMRMDAEPCFWITVAGLRSDSDVRRDLCACNHARWL